MNILFISKLRGELWAGINHSIPAQIEAQSKFDNVFWYNICDGYRDEWLRKTYFHNLKSYPSGRLSALPDPFSHPDLAVIEQIYSYPFSPILKDLREKKIPYIFIPRSSLTSAAQKKKPWKKAIGNALYFRRLIAEARAIQYLTEQEKLDSGDIWNSNSIVVPNGIEVPTYTKTKFNEDQIQAVFIGRIDAYQKGLDILFQALSAMKDELTSAHFCLSLYGPDYDHSTRWLNAFIKENNLDDIIQLKPAIYGKEKEAVLISSDVFILTSRFEGHPMGLIEALSCGVPCLITRGTNMYDEVSRSKAGWCAETNTEEIICAIRQLISEKKLLNKYGNNAKLLAQAYQWEVIAKKSHEIYKKIVQR